MPETTQAQRHLMANAIHYQWAAAKYHQRAIETPLSWHGPDAPRSRFQELGRQCSETAAHYLTELLASLSKGN